MRTSLAVALVVACTAAATGCSRGRPSDESFNWKGPVKADTWLRLRNANGDFDVREGTGDSAEIRLEITRSNHYAPSAQVKVLQTADGILACVLFGNDNTCTANEYRSGNSATYGIIPFMRGNTKVSGTILLPRGVKLDVENTNGDIVVDAIARDLKASTVNGDVTVKGSRGPVDIHTTNGDIDADVVGMAGAVKASSTNGDVNLTFPQALNAVLNMSTVNGDLELGFPGNVTTRTKKSIVATLGSGGAPIDVSTTNGSVTVKPSGAP